MGGDIHIDLRNIHGNRSCIQKLKIYKDGTLSEPLLTQDISSDFIKINSENDTKCYDKTIKNKICFCENTQMKIVLSDYRNNQIGRAKVISLLKLYHQNNVTVLKALNDEILRGCLIRDFHVSIYCRNSMEEKPVLTIRRSFRLNENLMDFSGEIYGKFCSLVEDDEARHWTFIGEGIQPTSTTNLLDEHHQLYANYCQSALIFQVLFCFTLLVIIISIILHLRRFLSVNTDPNPRIPGSPNEEVDNVPPLRDVFPRNMEQDRTSLRKRGSYNANFSIEMDENSF